jgi:hypothetical protein
MTMPPEMIVAEICHSLAGVIPKKAWGETALFYNPGHTLPHGVYFCTLKESDGENDRASHLDRDGVYRLSFGLPLNVYSTLFGKKPPRPAKGSIVNTGHDFSQEDILMPHPVYAWMGWVQILSPRLPSFEGIRPLIIQAHQAARVKFEKRLRYKPD